MTRAPKAFASIVQLKPTGPCPKIAMVSSADSATLLIAAKAVPVPQAMAAPVLKDSESGSLMRVCAGTFMKSACPPSAFSPPYTLRAFGQYCVQPERQYWQVRHPS